MIILTIEIPRDAIHEYGEWPVDNERTRRLGNISMRATKMNGITVSDAPANEILCGQALRSLVHENLSPLPLLCVLSECVILICINLNQRIGTVLQALDIRSMQDMMRNTPPR